MIDMDKEKYEGFLSRFDRFKDLNSLGQLDKKEEITELFKEFWDNNPTADEFDLCLSHMVLFPATIYYMVNHEK